MCRELEDEGLRNRIAQLGPDPWGFGEPVFDKLRQYSDDNRQNARTKIDIDELAEYAEDILAEALDILLSKHQDYGPKNIADAPGGPYVGLAVRLHDKVARLANLTSNNLEPKHESLRDTFVDILNYGLIGLLVLDGHWGE